jgi:hypothetical protein
VEAIVGAVTGPLHRPELLVMGQYRGPELEVSAEAWSSATTRLRRSGSC